MKNISRTLVCILTLTGMTPSVEAYTYQYQRHDYREYSTRPNYTYSTIPNITSRPNYTTSYVSYTNSRVVGYGAYVPTYYYR